MRLSKASMPFAVTIKRNIGQPPCIYMRMRDRSIGGGFRLKGNMEERACELATYILENKATVRATAKKFGISKSTVHKDIAERLPLYNKSLYQSVKEVLEQNKAERHLRGGAATRKKYKGEDD